MIKYRAACDCGWTGVYASRGRADHSLRLHSCERMRAKTAAAERGRRRRESVDKTPKPCLHKYADHQHGTHACYVLDLCRCTACSTANTVYERNRIRQKAYGRWDGLVDAAPAREHIKSLMAQGMGHRRVAEVSGVPHGVVSKLLYGTYRKEGGRLRGPSERIKPQSAERILAVTLDIAGGQVVDATGTHRRMQALVAMGYSLSAIGREIGLKWATNAHAVLDRPGVTKAKAEAVKRVYDAWSMKLPPAETRAQRTTATKARALAASKGWLPPLMWDDDTIDEPEPQSEPLANDLHGYLDEAAILRRMAGDKRVKLNQAEREEVVARLRRRGMSLAEIERTTGINVYRDAGAA